MNAYNKAIGAFELFTTTPFLHSLGAGNPEGVGKGHRLIQSDYCLPDSLTDFDHEE